MKNTYIAVSVQENNKHNAYVVKIHESDNVLSKLRIKGIECANICETKKRAEEVANYWNECYINNGTYMFA